jgi:hypothetical protein
VDVLLIFMRSITHESPLINEVYHLAPIGKLSDNIKFDPYNFTSLTELDTIDLYF